MHSTDSHHRQDFWCSKDGKDTCNDLPPGKLPLRRRRSPVAVERLRLKNQRSRKESQRSSHPHRLKSQLAVERTRLERSSRKRLHQRQLRMGRIVHPPSPSLSCYRTTIRRAHPRASPAKQLKSAEIDQPPQAQADIWACSRAPHPNDLSLCFIKRLR